VAKRLSAAPLTAATKIDNSELSRGATWGSVARIGFPLLLKTNLPRPPGVRTSGVRANFLSIAGDNAPSNDSTVTQLHRVPIGTSAVVEPERTSTAMIAQSNCRNAQGAEAAGARESSQLKIWGESGIR
jgi:hypothetical protein